MGDDGIWGFICWRDGDVGEIGVDWTGLIRRYGWRKSMDEVAA